MTAKGELSKLDINRQVRSFYAALAAPEVVEVPAMNFLMIDGSGDPNESPAYKAAIEALYGVSYTLKFALKRGPLRIDYRVMPLEGLWWADDMAAFTRGDRSRWQWTAMIMQPSVICAGDVEAAIAAVRRKRPPEALDKLRFENFREGQAAQLLHVGPYSAEGPNIEKLHAYIAARGGRLSGKHHEIYLSDPRRSAPEKLKTIIRQPFA